MHNRLPPRAHRPRSFAWLGIALGVVAAGAPLAFGAASDPFAVALPGRDTQPPEGQTVAGASSVSEQHGSASYAIPIEVPPGREGVAPSLALSYSSSAPLRGGLAVGWALNLPTIERDPANPSISAFLYDGQVLVPAPGDAGANTRYRVEHDESFARIERNGSSWTVSTPDGRMRIFTGSNTASDLFTRWNLTSERDAFGNTVVYSWSRVDGLGAYTDFRLNYIEYTSNAAAGLVAHARVDFTYAAKEVCGNGGFPRGAQSDHHFGRRNLRGSLRLTEIKTSVRDIPTAAWREARKVALTYDATELLCTNDRPPLRYLTQVDVSARSPAGVWAAQPPIQLGYGPKKRELSYTTSPFMGRYGDYGTEKGPEGSIMDFDGDGVADLVRVALPAEGTQRCRFFWRRGSFGGGFASPAAEQMIELPTAAWDGPNHGPAGTDSCTLNGQLAWRSSEIYGGGAYCKQAAVQVGYHFMDWDHDGDLDLVTSNWLTGAGKACGDFGSCPVETSIPQDNGNTGGCTGDSAPIEGDGSSTGPSCGCPIGEIWNGESCEKQCPSGHERDPSTGECQQTCSEFIGCGGSGPSEPPQPPGDNQPPACGFNGPQSEQDATNHIWRIYPIDEGQLDPEHPIERFLRMPLPPNGGELARPQDGQPSLPTLTDIDGDGWLDLVQVNDSNLGHATQLFIWRGNDAGEFSPTSTSWAKPSGTTWVQKPQQITIVGPDNLLSTSSTAELVDFDGDGLDDIVVEARNASGSSWSLYVSYNLGGSFAALEPLGMPGAVGQTRTELQSGWTTPMPMTAGWRAKERILTDLDADGLPELTLFGTTAAGVSQPASARVALRFNGDIIDNYVSVGTEWEPLERLVRAVNPHAWYRVNDFADLTGDGLPDLLTWSPGGGAYPQVRTDQPDAEPLRLLTTVDNGRGGVTRFGYARSTDPSAVSVTPWSANEPRWVVTKVTVTPGFGQPDMITAYHYEAPQRGTRSAYGKTPPAFLGYAKVTTSRASQEDAAGALSVKSFDYTSIGNDHRGHMVSEWTYMKSGRGYEPVRHETHSFTTAPLVGGFASFTYADTSTVRVCGVNATEAQCAVEDRNVKITRQTWTPWNGLWAGPIFYENVETTEEAPRADGTLEKRATVRDFAERAGQPPLASTDYRILQIEEQQQRIAPGGVATIIGRTRWYHDSAGLPYDTYSHITGSIVARTTRTFNAQTGQLLTIRRPNQAAMGGTKVTTFVYDQHKLFVAQTVNELGHKVIEKRDVATGVLVRREGPNVRTGQADPSCVPIRFVTICPIVSNYEPEEWVIDGFGRVTERRVATDPPGGGIYYLLTPVEWSFYYDQALPNQRKTQSLRDFTGSTRLTSTQRFDGMGRLLERHDERGGTLLDAITSYGYDAGGALHTMSVPDPRVDTGAVVTYTFTRDGLGRVITQGKPDGSAEVVNYYGPDVQVHTFSPTDGTEPGTELHYDPFGRLEAVNELTAQGGDAVTEYGYDELGRMTRVRDADGNLTVLGYDWAGNRTAVTRGARTWSYLYDFDGNLIQETSPVPTGELVADHTSVTEYDVLDRAKKHTPASRGMSDERRKQLGIGPISTTWDAAPNAIGQQVRVTMPFGTIDYSYDVRHQVKREQRTISLTHGASMAATQSVDRSYNALGAATSASWDDGTRWTTSYDARGLVSGVMRLDVAGGVYLPLVGYTRSLAGAPRQRLGGMYDQQREWQYDVLGRVTYDRVYRPSTNASLAERSYGYDGFGRLRTVDGQVDGMTADALYDYDNRGRVKRAQGPYGYDANLDYSGAGNITHAAVAGAADVPDRDVTYQYGAVDPMAVDRLLDTSGNVVADLDYDLAGNMIQRALPDGNVWALTVDASDQIREVSGPNGTETYYFGPNAERMVAIGPDGVKWWFGESETHFTPNGVQTRRWHHISTGEPIARIENQTTFELQYSDALQNLILSVTPTGEVAASFLYGAFGELVATSGSVDHRRQFNGKENDEVSGLRHYGYRSYDPLLLRWTAADPKYRFAPDAAWAEPQRANLYAFSLNNPLRHFDPDGRDPPPVRELPHGGFFGPSFGDYIDFIRPENDDSAAESAGKLVLVVAAPAMIPRFFWELAWSELQTPMGIPVGPWIDEAINGPVQTTADPIPDELHDERADIEGGGGSASRESPNQVLVRRAGSGDLPELDRNKAKKKQQKKKEEEEESSPQVPATPCLGVAGGGTATDRRSFPSMPL